MLTMLRVALVAACLLIVGAMPAAAQQAAPAPVPVEQPVAFSLTADQIGAIAVGAVLGAVFLDVMGGGLGHLTGAVLGGVAGYWLYSQPAPAPAPATQGG
ncbi:hypothetical protein [Thalassobaculum sp.]|uniref:hypothetical protein n=1 Tax=Thalassobaculum sp. TaxID=2022740 RepID=UPI0032ED6844